ncbi:hypothetical protein R3P38DRAFT_3205976 [Favolaschia claudopus]|uniref:Phosphotransferase n=1 Tax=Favolaschia claudopus TaxID=2862362 RepID=A0AAW0AP90_9AGAR
MINTEWGALNETSLFRPTPFDEQVDHESANPKHYRFQKLTSWFYLGEISRFILLELVSKRLLFNGKATEALKRHGSFATFHLFKIEDAPDLTTVKTWICDLFDYEQNEVSDEDADIVKQIAGIVAVRSGRMVGCPIAALITHMGYDTDVETINIAVDGEFFIGSTQFEARLKKSVATILGNDVEHKLKFHHVQGNGFIGGAIAALEGAHGQIPNIMSKWGVNS